VASCAAAIVGFLAVWDAFIATALLGLLASISLGITSLVRIGRHLGQRGSDWAWLGILLPFIACFLGLLALPVLEPVRDRGGQLQSQNNLKQIAIGMQNYADANGGRLPPAVVRHSDGQSLYSWRVLLLPYVEAQGLYERFKLDEPWDSPHNAALLDEMPAFYRAPWGPGAGAAHGGMTYYQVFVGPGTPFEVPQGPLFPGDFPDGTCNTVLVAEAGEPVPWTKPVDLVYDPDGPLPELGGIFRGKGSHFNLFGRPERGTNVATADGVVHFRRPSVSETTWRGGIVRNDGAVLGPDW
jgi:hypothetical protein